jgi:hypothetical protein
MRNYCFAALLLTAATAAAQNAPAVPAIEQRLDTPQVRVYVATLQPRTPSISRNGHATNRVIIYLDDGSMTRTDKGQTNKIDFKRGDVRWVPSSGAYTAENVSDHPIRILEIDLKGAPSGPTQTLALDPVKVDAKRYTAIFENEFVRVLRIHFEAHDKGANHEHRLNRVVLYLNDQTGGKKDSTRIAGAATHVEENTGDTAADRIAVEIK